LKPASRRGGYARTLLLFAALAPLTCGAEALDAAFDCSLDAHRFIAPLQAEGAIGAQASRVEDNSINVFFPHSGGRLYAYDFSVFAVVGFQRDDALFRHGSGDPVADSAYGVVAFGATDDVEHKVRAAGSHALVRHAGPHLTAIICKSPA
jgi:hypothetical protein